MWSRGGDVRFVGANAPHVPFVGNDGMGVPPAAWQMMQQQTAFPNGFAPLVPPPQKQPSCLDRCKLCLCIFLGVSLCCAPFFFLYCHILANPLVNYAAVHLSNKYLSGRDTYLMFDVPVQQSEELLASCADELEGRFEMVGSQWGYYPGYKAPFLHYRCSKVPGMFEKMPPKLRGVFWMEGVAIAEELVSLQHGQWFDEERMMLAPMAPFTWSWPKETPAEAPLGGLLHTEADKIGVPAHMITGLSTAAFKFEECPGGPTLPFPFAAPGHACPGGTGVEPEMTYAKLQIHPMGNLTVQAKKEDYTIEEIFDEAQPGSKFHRGIYGGPEWMGRCKCVSLGSYTLKKIVDGEGNPVEPHYSDWVRYIGSGNLLFWAGHTDPKLKKAFAKGDIAAAIRRSDDLMDRSGLRPQRAKLPAI